MTRTASNPGDLLARLDSANSVIKLKALREVKNQIIGNPTKKLSFIELGAIAVVASILADATAHKIKEDVDDILIQSTQILGRFADGTVKGIRAVIDSGALYNMMPLIRHRNEKVIEAAEHSLKTIDDSHKALAPHYDLIQPNSMESLFNVLESNDENVSRLGAIAVCNSCHTSSEQEALQDIGIKERLIPIVIQLLDKPGDVGDYAGFALCGLIRQKADFLKLAYDFDAIKEVCQQLKKDLPQPKRFAGLLLAMAEMCSKQRGRSRFIELELLDYVLEALASDAAIVRAAACICLRNVSPSIQEPIRGPAGYYMNNKIVFPLVKLFNDSESSVQIAALDAVSNFARAFYRNKKALLEHDGLNQLILLAGSAETEVRSRSLWIIHNLTFPGDDEVREHVRSRMTFPFLADLLVDSSPYNQRQALGIVRNLLAGSKIFLQNFFDQIGAESGNLLKALGIQMQMTSLYDFEIEGMYVFVIMSSGTGLHKEAVMQELFSQDNSSQHFVSKFLQSNDSRLRTAAVGLIVSLTSPSSSGVLDQDEKLQNRVAKLWKAGIVPQIKSMFNDPCVDVKLLVTNAIKQIGAVRLKENQRLH